MRWREEKEGGAGREGGVERKMGVGGGSKVLERL